MTVFIWTDAKTTAEEFAEATQDRQTTMWVTPSAFCTFCGEPMLHGQKAWAWDGCTNIIAHAVCVKARATGIMKDIAECLR